MISIKCQQLPVLTTADTADSDTFKIWLSMFNDLQLYDIDYVKNYNLIAKNKNNAKDGNNTILVQYKNKQKYIDVDKLNIAEVLTLLTYYSKNYCDGFLDQVIANGTLSKLSTRLYNLTKQEDI